jgi:hypothetical protein
MNYLYELRRGEEIIATGQLDIGESFEIGQRIRIAGHTGIVRDITPIIGQNGQRLVLQILPNADDS